MSMSYLAELNKKKNKKDERERDGKDKKNNGNSPLYRNAKTVRRDEFKINKGDLCTFSKKSISVIIPLDKMNDDLSMDGREGWMTNPLDTEKVINEFKMPVFFHQQKSMHNEIDEAACIETEKALFQILSNWKLRTLIFLDCAILDTERFKKSYEEAVAEKREKGSNATLKAYEINKLKMESMKEIDIVIEMPCFNILYTRILNALKGRLDLLNQQANNTDKSTTGFVNAKKIGAHIKLTINVEGIDFYVLSNFTTLNEKELENIKEKTFVFPNKKRMVHKPLIRYHENGPIANVSNERRFAIVEYIESAYPEERSTGILPICLIKKS